MIDFIKKYSAFGIGFIITLSVISYLDYKEVIRVPNDSPIEVVLIFTFWWFFASLPIYKFSYLKKKKTTLFKIIGLLVFAIITLNLDSKIAMPDNPVTIFMVTVFWIGLLYIISPNFIKKYGKLLFVIYGCAMLYFTYVRLFSPDFQYYIEHEKKYALNSMLLPLPLFIGLWIYEQWKWLKSLQTDKTKAELEMLKTQVNPHFFFNTLNNLYALTVKNSDKAPDVILKLSDMMRYTIYEGKKEVVQLEDEVKYLKNYIELHKIRYHKKVDIQFTHLIEENNKVAPLLFIILLENAFKHGVESLSGEAKVKIELISSAQEIYFSVENNFDVNQISKEKGMGLDNLKRRLDLAYPQKYQFISSEEGNVFKTELKITVS